MGMCGVCASVHECEREYAEVARCAQVCVSGHKCARVYTGVCGSAWVSASVCVCGMDSQNIYWRIESLHFIRIFCSNSTYHIIQLDFFKNLKTRPYSM